MKSTFVAIVLASLVPLAISGDEDRHDDADILTFEAPCYDTKTLFDTLRKQYKESPIIAGTASDVAGSTMSLWMHPVDKSWTIVATKDDLSCVIGVGTDFKVIQLRRNLI
jgi:hypothetical protein